MQFNKLIPELSVSDIEKSRRFYADVLGFKAEYERKEQKFIFLSFQGSQLMIEEINEEWKTGKLEHPFGRGINFQIEADDINPILESLKKNSYPVKHEPKERWYKVKGKLHGQKEFLVMDPDGYLLRFAQDLGTKES